MQKEMPYYQLSNSVSNTWQKTIFYTLAIVSVSIASGNTAIYAQGQPGNYPSNDMINNSYNANPVANSFNNPFASLEAPKYHPNFWNQAPPVNNSNSGGRIIDANVVINGVLQEDISSKKSKAGDIFSIMLTEDYKVNDVVMIPKNSSFVGAVVASTPSQGTVNGVPGSLQVSIQTLVSPRGISIPINAVIEYDPAQHSKQDIKKSRGVPVGEWAKSAEYAVYYTVGSLGSRFGVPVLYKGQTNSGAEFSLTKGELLPVKLSQPLDVTPLAAECQQNQQQSQQWNQQSSAPQNWQFNGQPNMPPSAPRSDFAPSINQPNGQNNMMPGFASPAGPEPF